MTTLLAERRKRDLLTLALVALGVAIVAAITIGVDVRAAKQTSASGLVLPNLSENLSDARRISVVSDTVSYEIECVQRDGACVWLMRDHGDYPVSAGPIARLVEGLRTLEYTRRMTSDPSKHARLGVEDPREDGRGVLIQIEDPSRGALLVDIILGVQPNGGLYVRKPGDNQVWAARGDLPPLRDVSIWMDLAPLNIDPATLESVEITPREGEAYVLARSGGEASFAFASPRATPNPGVRLDAIAERITGLEPIDVQTAPAIQGEPFARIRALTAGGITIDAELIESEQRVWIKMVARAEEEENQPAALELNARIAEWAFELRPERADLLAPPLADIAAP